MDQAQMTPDAAEDRMVRRYREHRSTVRHGLTVSCGHRGTSQLVHSDRGRNLFALSCFSCHGKTLVTLPAAH